MADAIKQAADEVMSDRPPSELDRDTPGSSSSSVPPSQIEAARAALQRNKEALALLSKA